MPASATWAPGQREPTDFPLVTHSLGSEASSWAPPQPSFVAALLWGQPEMTVDNSLPAGVVSRHFIRERPESCGNNL